MTNIYLYSQSKNNNGIDDWYEFNIQSGLSKVQAESEQAKIHNFISSITATGKNKDENKIKAFYEIKRNNSIDIVFLIDNGQKDDLGRVSKTVLAIQNFDEIKKISKLEFQNSLKEFWEKTDRVQGNVEVISNDCYRACTGIFDEIKKKNSISLKVIMGVVMILVFLIIILKNQ
ncbi:hypothetical protein I2F27_12055 [Acinetobacter sp. B5B]|uniref:hypothetical protein n=1 Tax=Acinetobacter baretiae TaxID=2605383 RepID=UPI0018C33799|nr:hypothetical protein [Acinetobacter baretiae]MBF7684021.1 hypothetical protein [Acinetobacter baretiae]MBF7684031.1 hypothetical protein [Acinetobacter baretiae]